MTNRNPEAQFRKRAIDVMASHSEVVSARLDKTEKTVNRLAEAIEQQTTNIANLSANVERLERSVTGLSVDMRQLTSNISLMVEENRSQRETMNSLIKLATTLVEKQAS